MEGAETLESLWQQKAGPGPVDLFESAVKHRAAGYAAQRTRKEGEQASVGEEGCITEGNEGRVKRVMGCTAN